MAPTDIPPSSRENGRSALLDCWFVTGPTAGGKTAIGIELARRIGAEIIALDSMTVYRGMDIGTAKATVHERAVVPHHLIDIVDPETEFSVADFVAAAHRKVAEIRLRGRDVLFVGGTPLYLKALLRGLVDGPPADWRFRREVESELKKAGPAALHQRLRLVDPLSAARLHPNDTRRLIRALEFYKITGQPISHRQLQFDEGAPAESCRVFAIRRSPEALHARIEARVDAMFSSGFVEEVRGLTSGARRLGRTAGQAVGYREIVDYLARGGDLEGVRDDVKRRTRRFARRQGTWYRSLSECRHVDAVAEETPQSMADRIVGLAGRAHNDRS